MFVGESAAQAAAILVRPTKARTKTLSTEKHPDLTFGAMSLYNTTGMHFLIDVLCIIDVAS